MKQSFRLNILYGAIITLFMTISLTGCTYTKEELQAMKEHEKQGETNALNYIKEKYGFDAAVTEVRCEKVASGFLDFTPASTGDVFVTMEYDEKTFLVSISGEQETTEGFDNYQFEEIKAALTQKLYDITNLPIEELYISYGKYQTMKNNMHGMINTYFDGNNLAEIMVDESRAVAVSYINQDVSTIDMDKVAEETGIEYYLFVDYDSKEHYETIKQPYYNIAGSPIDSDIDDNMLYINGYRVTSSVEDTYVDCEKTIIDDVILITEYPEEEISIEKTTIHPASNWNGHGFRNAKQVFDAYALNTDSDMVYIYVPVDKLYTEDLDQVVLVKQYEYESSINYRNVLGGLTDDEKYVHGTIYTRDYMDIKFSVFTDEE